MNELIFNGMMILAIVGSFAQYKKDKKKLPVIVAGILYVVFTIAGNLLQNHQTIQIANSLDMIGATIFSIVVLGAFIMLPIIIGIKKSSN